MKKPNKKQRLAIYKKMLEYVDKNEYTEWGMCLLIYRIVAEKHPRAIIFDQLFDIENYPELMKQKPKTRNHIQYWYKRGCWGIRKKIIINAIKMITNE